jgi:hypothetical protein
MKDWQTAFQDFIPAEAALATVVSANATCIVDWPYAP